MTLQNLQRIGRVKPHSVSAQEIARLPAASERNIADAQVTRISAETRFDAGYKAVMQCALAAMMASGYRPSTSEAGHHATLIQCLPLTLSVPDDAWVVLDALRRKRNANDYTGDVVTADMVVECIAQAQALRAALIGHLQRNHPQLLA